MSHFYAAIPRSARRTVPTACGTQHTGITTHATSHAGAIEVTLWRDYATKQDKFAVYQIPWLSVGESHCIATGIVGKAVDRTAQAQKKDIKS